MDLKGSIIDTNLMIYPTGKLIDFVKTISPSDELPHNILQIINSKTIFKSYKLHNLKQVHLNNSDVECLKKIRDSIGKVDKNEPTEELYQESNVDTEVRENIEDVKKQNPKEKIDKKNKTIEKQPQKNDNISCGVKDKNEIQKPSKELLNNDKCPTAKPFLVTSDIDWLYDYIKSKRDNGEKNIPYLHQLLEGAFIEVPENETIKRNPILEARCVKLRAQQEAREYRKMTKSVDNVRMKFPEDSISYQLKQVNRQLIAIGQFIISIFAGFLFGFRGVEWMVGNLDFGFRLLLGVMCALVIALAEIYFLAKKLNEELSIPETVQLGGPVKFADQDSYDYKSSDSVSQKLHQD